MRIILDTFSSGEISVEGDRDTLHSSQCDVLFQVPQNTQNFFFFGTPEIPPSSYLRLETRTFTNVFKLHDIALSGLVTVLSNLQLHP